MPTRSFLLRAFAHTYNSCRRCSKRKRVALVSLDDYPWMKLYRDGDDSFFLVIISLSRRYVNKLLQLLFTEGEIIPLIDENENDSLSSARM